jgi:F-type H+-transporting ATPase subunit beta
MKAGDYKAVGQVVQVIGPVVDVQFEEEKLPAIYNAIRITSEGFDVPVEIDIIAEAQQHLGEGRVRCVAMKPTDGMVRGMKAFDTGSGITVPVGQATLGRVMNVLGEPVDNLGPIEPEAHYPIHRPARPWSSWNSSTTWPWSTAACRCFPAWANAPAKAMTCGWK